MSIAIEPVCMVHHNRFCVWFMKGIHDRARMPFYLYNMQHLCLLNGKTSSDPVVNVKTEIVDVIFLFPDIPSGKWHQDWATTFTHQSKPAIW
jgi:hypothetical protein